MKLQFTDKFSVSRYGEKRHFGRPKGTKMYERFNAFPRWKRIEINSLVDYKNDNRTDVHRGFLAIFGEVSSKQLVKVKSYKSNTGKTIECIFTDE